MSKSTKKTKITPVMLILLVVAVIVILRYNNQGSQSLLLGSGTTSSGLRTWCAPTNPPWWARENYNIYSGTVNGIFRYCYETLPACVPGAPYVSGNCDPNDCISSWNLVNPTYLGTCYTIYNNLPTTAITASASSSQNSYGPEKVIDNSVATTSYWESLNQVITGQWIKLQWTTPKMIDSINITCVASCRAATGKLEYYNPANSSWVILNESIKSQAGGFVGMPVKFAPVTTSMIRWYGTSGGDYIYIHEIGVHSITPISKVQTFSVNILAETVGTQTIKTKEETASIDVTLKNI